jgi:hypothetical protein
LGCNEGWIHQDEIFKMLLICLCAYYIIPSSEKIRNVVLYFSMNMMKRLLDVALMKTSTISTSIQTEHTQSTSFISFGEKIPTGISDLLPSIRVIIYWLQYVASKIEDQEMVKQRDQLWGQLATLLNRLVELGLYATCAIPDECMYEELTIQGLAAIVGMDTSPLLEPLEQDHHCVYVNESHVDSVIRAVRLLREGNAVAKKASHNVIDDH